MKLDFNLQVSQKQGIALTAQVQQKSFKGWLLWLGAMERHLTTPC